jgi:sugar lactone lactonase YvrE
MTAGDPAQYPGDGAAVTVLGHDDVFVAEAGELCEGPCWDERTGQLVWVDILAGRVLSVGGHAGHVQSRALGMPVSAVAPRASGGWIAAVERGFALFDDCWGPAGGIRSAEGQAAGTRFNDGKCDPAGRFWAGTMAYDGTPGAGCLYRLGTDGSVTPVIEDVTTSNGLGWSPDSGTMYFADTGHRTVDTMRFDAASGTPSHRQPLVTVPPEEGQPDGLAVDSEGFIWVALWDGGAVRRYSPGGALDRVVQLPVTRVTSMAFGGPDLGDLYITTAHEGLSPRQRAEQPLAGSVFRHRPGVAGLPPARFGG